LLLAPSALARAGGGSSHFGGGGGSHFGGGGGGFSGGGYHSSGYGGSGHISTGALLAILVVGGIIGLWFFGALALGWWLARRRGESATVGSSLKEGFSRTAIWRKAGERAKKVELASAEAAEDDAAFAADVVKPAAAKLFTDIQTAWSANNTHQLKTLVDDELFVEWERRLNDFDRKGWRNRVDVLNGPQVEYVGMRNVAEDDEDQVTVLIRATVQDYVVDKNGRHLSRTDSSADNQQVQEFWTLSKRDGHWILHSIEQELEGQHALTDDIVATPWSDEKAMHDEAMIQNAVAEAAPSVAEVADLDYEGDARSAALDLSLADGRFAPDVLEIAARRAVSGWAEAIDGEDDALLSIAHAEVAREMLHPGDPSAMTRVVVRGLQVDKITIVALDAAATPPTMTIEVHLAGRRYIENRDTLALVSGSQSKVTKFTERWILALDGPAVQPWRIAAVASAAAGASRG
jgi:predicted lipid-binding transport protein (Tim44 family)